MKLVQQTLSTAVNIEDMHPATQPVFTYPLQTPGKQLRSALVLLCAHIKGHNRFSSAYRQQTAQVAAAVELLHLATLLHDDVLDEAANRRGKPTLNTLRGNKSSILTGD